MKPLTPHLTRRLLLATLPALALAACGGGDTEDRLDVADPAVRFVDASAVAPTATLYKGTAAQPDATGVSYGFASNYFDIGTDSASWSVKAATGNTTLGSVTIDPLRGTKYTIVALATSATDTGVVLVVDPYNKPLTSDSARLRLVHGVAGAPHVDLYLQARGTSIASTSPLIADTAFEAAGPATGSDSVDVPGGDYEVTITAAGTKTVVFRGLLSVVNNSDILLVAVPDPGSPGNVQVLEKLEGTPGTTALPTS